MPYLLTVAQTYPPQDNPLGYGIGIILIFLFFVGMATTMLGGAWRRVRCDNCLHRGGDCWRECSY